MIRSHSTFLKYLGGLALATMPSVALAGAPPAPTVKDTVAFAANLKDKVPAAAAAPIAPSEGKELAWWPWPQWPQFGEVWPQFTFTQIQPSLTGSAGGGETALLPSEAFKLIRGS